MIRRALLLTLQVLPVFGGAKRVPAVLQDTLNIATVDVYQQFLGKSAALQGPQKKTGAVGLS